jgi:hypothetical protein
LNSSAARPASNSTVTDPAFSRKAMRANSGANASGGRNIKKENVVSTPTKMKDNDETSSVLYLQTD